jgi:hypothetical protein
VELIFKNTEELGTRAFARFAQSSVVDSEMFSHRAVFLNH